MQVFVLRSSLGYVISFLILFTSHSDKSIDDSFEVVLSSSSFSIKDYKTVTYLFITRIFCSKEARLSSTVAEEENGWSEIFCWIGCFRSV